MDKEAIYKEFLPKVSGYVGARLKNHAEAEEAVSDVFVKVYANLDRYDASKASLSTCIYIAMHKRSQNRTEHTTERSLILKTLDELRNEVMANEELKKTFTEALVYGKAVEFAAAQGVTATKEEIKAALSEVTARTEGELSDEEMANVAGGCAPPACPKCGSENTDYENRHGEVTYTCYDCYYWCDVN